MAFTILIENNRKRFHLDQTGIKWSELPFHRIGLLSICRSFARSPIHPKPNRHHQFLKYILRFQFQFQFRKKKNNINCNKKWKIWNRNKIFKKWNEKNYDIFITLVPGTYSCWGFNTKYPPSTPLPWEHTEYEAQLKLQKPNWFIFTTIIQDFSLSLHFPHWFIDSAV